MQIYEEKDGPFEIVVVRKVQRQGGYDDVAKVFGVLPKDLEEADHFVSKFYENAVVERERGDYSFTACYMQPRTCPRPFTKAICKALGCEERLKEAQAARTRQLIEYGDQPVETQTRETLATIREKIASIYSDKEAEMAMELYGGLTC